MSYFPMQALFVRTNSSQVDFTASTQTFLDMDVSVKGASTKNGSSYTAPSSASFITCTDIIITASASNAARFQTYISGANLDQGDARQASPNDTGATLVANDVSWGEGTQLAPTGNGISTTNSSASEGDLMMFGMVLS